MLPACLFLSHELQRKHFLQDCKNCCESTGGDTAKSPNEALAVDCAKLVYCDKTGAIAKTTPYTPGIGLPSSRRWRDDHCPQMLIQLIGRNDQAGALFFGFHCLG